MSFTVEDESTRDEQRLQLYANARRDQDLVWKGKRALITRHRKNGATHLHFQVYGPVQLEEAREIVEGLLHLLVRAEGLTLENKDAKEKS